MQTASTPLSKVPAITLGFWIIKIFATTLGETGGDALSMSMNLGYAVSTIIFAALFVVAAAAQIAAKKYHPFLYWSVIIATTTVGTTMADYVTRSIGIGYLGGSSLLFAMLMCVLALWWLTLGSISVNHITNRSMETFYWLTILYSNTLGTALGDYLSDSPDFGYVGGAAVFAGGLALIAAAYYWTKLSRTFLFWTAFILTRPLGATLGDILTKPLKDGGLDLSRYTSSAVLAVGMVLLVLVASRKAGKHPQST